MDPLEGHTVPAVKPLSPAPSNFRILDDIKERAPRNDGVPSPPRFASSSTGFPAPRDRRVSKFKKHHQNETARQDVSSDAEHLLIGKSTQAGDQHNIKDPDVHQENQQRLDGMTEEEKLREQESLMNALSPSLIERFLNRTNTGDSRAASEKHTTSTGPAKSPSAESSLKASQLDMRNRNAESIDIANDEIETLTIADKPPLHPPADVRPVASKQPLPQLPNFHFPKPSSPPELDPDDPDFRTKLHAVYYPNLPADPSSLSWMKAPTQEENDSYSTSQASLPVSSLRFDFRGRLIPPRLSSVLPVTKGLHHHGQAPSSAGYTVPELAHLARSVVPSQKCIAFQTFGRILYRLGKGEYGREGDVLRDGLWDLVEKSKALQIMIEAAARENEGNRSVWATATDAVWMWRKGQL